MVSVEKWKMSILIDETQSEKSMVRDSMNELRKFIYEDL
jgi:hypothetical protein